ncbi:hypothetical protein DRN87_02640 [Candidatus Geothermarchaeota archaeon]|nr:MAG: hypothetical protein DRN87_02640 [Candidatus Geothermarchaeota archaeon]
MYEYIILILEYITVYLLIHRYIKHYSVNLFEKLDKLYEFITLYYLTRSLPTSIKSCGYDELRRALKGEDISISLIPGERNEFPILGEREIAMIKVNEIINMINNKFIVYTEKIDIYALFILASLIFPPILTLILLLSFDSTIILMTPVIQLLILLLTMRRIVWMKRE